MFSCAYRAVRETPQKFSLLPRTPFIPPSLEHLWNNASLQALLRLPGDTLSPHPRAVTAQARGLATLHSNPAWQTPSSVSSLQGIVFLKRSRSVLCVRIGWREKEREFFFFLSRGMCKALTWLTYLHAIWKPLSSHSCLPRTFCSLCEQPPQQ